MKSEGGVMFNAYPDSIGNDLSDIVSILKSPEFNDVFSLFYVLPTFFNSDLDRGFSIIDYNINDELVKKEDLTALKELGIQLKFDIVLNHLSVASSQFQDLLKNGDKSEFKDFFIDWNEFWEGQGKMNEEGIVIPNKEHLDQLFMRKTGLPILKVLFPDGTERPYWNTFYNKVTTQPRTYLGQMDVNAKSPLVWKFYEEVLEKVKDYGGSILRLDAFAYLHKEVGSSNFFNKPGTWDYLGRINDIAQQNELELLPEIHSEYGSYLHQEVSDQGYRIYDFFLPGLIIHTIEKKNNTALMKWAHEIVDNNYETVNMLGCHDGIPVLDLKGKQNEDGYAQGLLNESEIEELMDIILQRGGIVKNLYDAEGNKLTYYQVNATYFSAIGEDEKKLLLARAIQLFMPGIPQVWYLDLFAGKNDHQAVKRAGDGGHKDINRTNLTLKEARKALEKNVVKKQLEMIRFRNTCPAFSGEVTYLENSQSEIKIKWTKQDDYAILTCDLKNLSYSITYSSSGNEGIIS